MTAYLVQWQPWVACAHPHVQVVVTYPNVTQVGAQPVASTRTLSPRITFTLLFKADLPRASSHYVHPGKHPNLSKTKTNRKGSPPASTLRCWWGQGQAGHLC